MKSLNVNVILSWEFSLIFNGLKRDKNKPFNDIGKIPFIKPTTKMFFVSLV